MYSMPLMMDFKVASDTDVGILKSIVGITKKIENNLRGDNTIAVGLLESNTVDVGVLGGNTIDVGVPIPEVNALPQVLHANDVGVVGVTQTGIPCAKGAQCMKDLNAKDDIGMHEIVYICDCDEEAGGKYCHYLSTNYVLAFNTRANNFTSLTPIIFRVVYQAFDDQLSMWKGVV